MHINSTMPLTAIPLLDITKETEPLTNAVNGSDIIYSQL